MTEPPQAIASNRLPLLLGLVALTSYIAGMEWFRVFGLDPVALRLVVCAVVPVVIVGTLGRKHSLALSGVVSLVALFWFMAIGVLHYSIAVLIPTPAAVEGIYQGVINGWSGILSLPLTVAASPDLLVFPCALIWLSSMVGGEIVQRTRIPLAAMVPPVASFVVALFFGVGGANGRVALALALVSAVLAFAAVTARPLIDPVDASKSKGSPNDKGLLRRVVEMGIVGLCALLIALLLGGSVPLIAGGKPYNPRAATVPPSSPVQAINPLDQLAVWASHPEKPVMTVRSSYSGPWRLAVLPAWDPVDGWTTSDVSTYYRIGTEVPGPTLAPATVATGEVAAAQKVHVLDLPGPWLPAAQRPVAIKGIQALAQPASGELLSASGRATGAAYTVASSVPTSTPNGSADGPGSAPLITGIPASIQALAVQMTQGAVTPWAKASALVGALAKSGGTFAVQPSAPSGTNTQVLQNFLVGTGPTAHQGTSEQFAGGFALLAEALNLPTRVVVEFHAGTDVDGVWHVSTHDAFAADEVEFAGVGWVLFDPTPRSDSTPAPKDETVKGSGTISASTPPLPSSSPKQYVQGTPPAHKSSPGMSPLVRGLVITLLVIVAVAVLLALIALLVATVRKRRTRRRRSAGLAHDRVIGAWVESLDLMRALGPPAPTSDTASELAAVGAKRLGASGSGDFEPLAAMANATLFSTWEPDDDAALEAWRHTDRVAEQIGDQLGTKGRIFRALDLRVLFRR